MKIIKYFISLLIFIMLSSPALADSNDISIRWEYLNLTQRQQQKMQVLDREWCEIQSLLQPKLIRDQEKLKLMLTNPDVSDTQIREIEKQIFIKQEQLRYYAMENFLAKRRILTVKQKVVLHEMLQIKYRHDR